MVHLVRLLLEFQLELLVVLSGCLGFELVSFNFTLGLTELVFEIFDLPGELHELVVFLDFNLVTLTSDEVALVDSIVSPALALFKVTSELFD